jgi:hypothetical protein
MGTLCLIPESFSYTNETRITHNFEFLSFFFFFFWDTRSLPHTKSVYRENSSMLGLRPYR